MKIIVTHMSPDLDAITSVWVLKRFLPGWEKADIEFVPAGLRSDRVKNHPEFESEPVLTIGNTEIIHVDTGLGPLDHHQTPDQNTCGAKRAWDFVQSQRQVSEQPLKEQAVEAISRIVSLVVAYDHFQEVFRPQADADYHDFSLFGINEGLQYKKPGEDDYYVEFGCTNLDYLLSYFENKVWAERELKIKNAFGSSSGREQKSKIDGEEAGNAIEFKTKYGKAIGLLSANESVVKLAQKKGYVLVIRKDPRRGHVSIKTLPNRAEGIYETEEPKGSKAEISQGIDLTLAYEQLKKMDAGATWFLHVSKKMLLNGSVKNPKMVPTTLSLDQIIKVLEKLYQ